MTKDWIRKSVGLTRFALLAGTAIAAVAPATAAAEQATYEIQAQPLGEALRQFALQSGAQVAFREEDTRGLTSRGVMGELEDGDALARLLEGTGLSAVPTSANTYVIRVEAAAPAPEPATTPQAEPEPPADPVPASAPDDEDKTLSAVVVTAQRREQRIQDVPVSMTVAGGEFLAESNITGLTDLSTRMPSVNITAAPGVTFMNIRGVGSGNNAGFEQAVGTFVDGVYRGRSRAAQAALFDVERVEVLRGPQTTFFGNNVIAGAMNITTRKPKFEFGMNGSALYAPDDGEYSVELGADLPVSDTLAIRVGGKLFGMDGYVHNEFLDRDEPRRRDAVGRVSLRWEPNSAWSTNFRADMGRMRDDTAVEAIDCPGDPAIYGPTGGTCARYLAAGFEPLGGIDYNSRSFGGSFDYDFTELALTNDYDLGFATLTSTTGYFEHDAQMISDGAPFGLPGFFGAETTQVINLGEEIEQFSQELRITSSTGGFFEYMAGVYYANESLDSIQHVGLYQAPFGVIIGPPLPPNAHVSQRVNFDQDTDNWSAFGSVTANLTDTVALDLGLRYSHITKDIVRDLTIGEGGPIPDEDAFTPYTPAQQAAAAAFFRGDFGNFQDPQLTNQKLMPSAKLAYNFTPDAMVYVSYSKGFKAGGFAQAPAQVQFDEETVDAYEAGIKATMLDGALFTALTVFRSDYKDLQEATQRVVNGVTFQTIANSAGSRAQGVEFSFNGQLTDKLALRGDVSYLDAVYKDFDSAPCTVLQGVQQGPNCIQDMSGQPRGFAPEWSGSLGLSYVQPIRDDLELRIDPLVYFTSDFYQSATADPLFEQPGYTKVDLRLGFGPADKRWEVALVGKNLTDEATASFRNQIAGAPGSMWVNPERPRSIAIQASFRR